MIVKIEKTLRADMGASNKMSRVAGCFFVILCGLWLFPYAALAADTEKLRQEIIYRTNLGRADDVALLIKQGANANEVNDAQVPLVSLAASRVDSEGLNVLKTLADAGADLEKKDSKGQTPLFYAARFGNRAALEYLLSCGVLFMAADNLGNTARSTAYAAGHYDLVEVLDEFTKNKNEELKAEYTRIVQERYEDAYKKVQERYGKNDKSESSKKETSDYAKTSADSVANNIRRMIYDLSFSSCEVIYWQHWSASGRKTELKRAELVDAFYKSRGRRNDLYDKLVEKNGIDKKLMYQIVKVSEGRVLATFVEAAKDGEDRIGTTSEMKNLCARIAGSW